MSSRFDQILGQQLSTPWQIANHITWGKKRAYGVQNNYLFTREECLYLIKGDPKKPRKFNPPYLDEKRSYAGYNPKYPAKDERYRRTNVWTDITEILQGKKHPAEKPTILYEIPILTHTEPGEWVLDTYAGSGTLAEACRKHDRKFCLVERDEKSFAICAQRIDNNDFESW